MPITQLIFYVYTTAIINEQRWATAILEIASLPLPRFVKFNSGATAAVSWIKIVASYRYRSFYCILKKFWSCFKDVGSILKHLTL